MEPILLGQPVASGHRLQRVNMFAGRHLGETELDRWQDYADARLLPLLASARPGVVTGLVLRPDAEGLSLSPGVAVSAAGEALGIHYPIRAQWSELIEHYLAASEHDSAAGVFYLVLRRSPRQVDAPTMDPCQRAEFDPTRDTRLVVVGEPALVRLAIDPAAVDSWPRERIENHVAAGHASSGFPPGLGRAVPLALVAIAVDGAGARVRWVSPEAGRYEAVADAGHRVLLAQVSAAIRRVMADAERERPPEVSLDEFLAERLRLDFLPATGQLPLEWLRERAGPAPSLAWLPQQIRVDMTVVPEQTVPDLLRRHLPRRPLDLREAHGERLRLILAVGERDYRADLLDIPPTDAVLEADVYRMFQRAWEGWRRWREQFDLLYHFGEAEVLDAAELRALGLPRVESPPPLPQSVFASLLAEAESLRTGPDSGLPHPYSRGVPDAPAAYRDWLQAGDEGPVPPPPAEADEDGLVLRYALGLRKQEALENRIRATRARLEKTRDLMLLKRQQLDAQTVSLASLAGGVAGDGSGLKVGRWLPFTRFERLSPTPAAAAPPTAEAGAGATTLSALGRFATGSAAMSAMPMVASMPATNATASLGAATTSRFAVTAPMVPVSMVKSGTSPQTATKDPVRPSGTGFGAATMASALDLSSKLSPALTLKPQSVSILEMGINATRLDLLARVAKETVTAPAILTRDHRFGVLDHIRPEIAEYAKAYRGMVDLRNTVSDLFDAPDARRLRRDLDRAGALQAAASDTLLREEQLANRLESPEALERRITTEARAERIKDAVARRAWRDEVAVRFYYEGLVKAGKILTQWLAIVEGRYNAIERRLEGMLREQSGLAAEQARLAAEIRVARETLESHERDRVARLSEYALAQRLLGENWRAVHRRWLERARILESGVRALYYVRPRSARLGERPADPLSLRPGRAGDPVPGCRWEEDVDLPAALEPFIEAVGEVALRDWPALAPLIPRLPLDGLERFAQLRKSRLQTLDRPLPAGVGGSLRLRLGTVLAQNRTMLLAQAGRSLPGAARTALAHRDALAGVMSLADLAANGSPSLRRKAEAFRERLEQCQYCLLGRLSLISPSLRLQWAQLAEHDRLAVDSVARWPGLERAEREDFDATRSVAELVAWWFRQLSPNASADARAAMRNMVRAALIHSALGNPQALVSGRVRVPPRATAPGERLRVTLDALPTPGTVLQLLDSMQRPVATLAVEDQVGDSTEVRIVEVLRSGIAIDSGFSVVSTVSPGPVARR
jgi:hypothetical protein